MQVATTYKKEEIWDFLKEIYDPEIPVLNIVEMGIARDVLVDGEKVKIKITPTYSGCPAMHTIENEIGLKLAEKGVEDFEIKKDFSEIWTTDWMTDHAKEKLKNYGIAPPEKNMDNDNFFSNLESKKVVACPYCDSQKTKLQSEFGSTACKAQYYCNNCEEPFEHFKCI